ncbi:MAG: histone deacetylase family protein [Methanomicrobiales archaeon]
MITGIVTHTHYLVHEQSPTHPERRERIAYTMDLFDEEEIGSEGVFWMIEPRYATEEDVLAVHSRGYIEYLRSLDQKGGVLDMNTCAPPGFFKSALLSAGGALSAAESVLSGAVKNAFALIRPPGHHAGRNFSGGFCYINNVAVMSRAIQRAGLERVMIIDWDAHHGDGTQDIFYGDPDVLFVSVHQEGIFPGSGSVDEIGEGEGTGRTINLPIPSGSSDDVYRLLTEEIVIPAAREFRPDFIAVSAGQDNHFTDHRTDLAMTARGYADMMSRISALSGELCERRLVAVLEGGYGVETALPYVNLGIIAALGGLDLDAIREPASYEPMLREALSDTALPAARKVIDGVRGVHSEYWSCF